MTKEQKQLLPNLPEHIRKYAEQQWNFENTFDKIFEDADPDGDVTELVLAGLKVLEKGSKANKAWDKGIRQEKAIDKKYKKA